MVYKGTTYTECTTADNDQPWCETVASTSAGMKWGNCDCKNAPSVAAPSSDTLLTSYWDYGVCGPHGDDHNSDWCKESLSNNSPLSCKEQVTSSKCPSGKANFVKVVGNGKAQEQPYPASWGSISIDGCDYAFYAQYECAEAAEASMTKYGS